MRLAMKLGVSLATTTPLPSWTSQNWVTASISGAVGFWRGNDFQQAHVARRIEEVRAEPGAAEVVGEAFGDFGHGKSAGVGGDDGAGLADGFYFLEQVALDFQILDDGFDDPVDVG